VAENVIPVAIAGAGPTGIACAVELRNRGIAAVCYDKGSLLDSLYHFPEEMRWFSTRDLLDIAGVPFAVPEAHPTRLEALAYYRGIAEKFDVRIEPESRVESIVPGRPGGLLLTLIGRKGLREVAAPAAILATGFFHNPRKLHVPGEDLSHVIRASCPRIPSMAGGAKRAAAFAAFLLDELLADVGHAQWVFTVPKLLRPYFMHHPELLGPLCSAAWETVCDLMAETVCEKQGFRPGMVAVVQTFGDQLNLHPHVHALVCAAPLLTAPPDRRRGKSNFLSLIP